jgi:hypothetical protein
MTSQSGAGNVLDTWMSNLKEQSAGEETDRWLHFGDQIEIMWLSGFSSRD